MSILNQKTVNSNVTFEGIGLHTGINSKITIKPSSPNSGIIFVEDGIVTFSATGIGSPTEDGGNSWKGVTYFETSAPSLTQLNGKCIVYNWDVDAQGVAVWELFEYS